MSRQLGGVLIQLVRCLDSFCECPDSRGRGVRRERGGGEEEGREEGRRRERER